MATPQDALSAAHASWNAGDLDGYLELYDERIALHGYAPEPMGKAEVRGFYAAVFAAFDSRSSTSTRCSGRARRRRSASP
jgi:ketosteroid isomerase-like protein